MNNEEKIAATAVPVTTKEAISLLWEEYKKLVKESESVNQKHRVAVNPRLLVAYEMAVKALEASKDDLTLNDAEKRIFLAAMGRECNICRETDKKVESAQGGGENKDVKLVPICREIERKVKKALWS